MICVIMSVSGWLRFAIHLVRSEEEVWVEATQRLVMTRTAIITTEALEPLSVV